MRTRVASHLKTWVILGLLSSGSFSGLRAQSIWNGALGGNHFWNVTTNWTPNSAFPSGIDVEARFQSNLTSALNVTLGTEVTLGKLSIGDTGSTYYSTTIGLAGERLIFDVSSGNALLELGTAGNTQRDRILADVVLNDTVEIRLGSNTGPGLDILGTISGAGGILKSNLTGTAPTTSASSLKLLSRNNSYTGDTIIEHGMIEFSGSVLKNQNSALGNTDSAILIGTAASPETLIQYSVGASLALRASNDTEHYEISRDLDFSQGAESQNTNGWRAVFNFYGDGSGGVNTNRLELSGDLILGGRTTAITAERQGMEIYITGDMLTRLPASGNNRTAQNIMFNTIGAGTGTDGVAGGTIRFSNRARTYTNTNILTNGTIIIEGSVGALNTASPIGMKAISLSDGSGGNILSNLNGVRSVFMADADTHFNRDLSLGVGNSTTPSGAGATYYGAGAMNVYNGFKIGGLNTSGVVTFAGNITSSTAVVGDNKKITIGHNLALISQTGGTVDFKGVISDSSSADYATRVTINQFRNHSELDTNADGVLNVEANQAVGTATQGTVRLYGANTYEGGTEVMGGSLLVRNTTGSATGTGMILVNAGTKFGGSGTVSPGSKKLQVLSGGILTPGDPTLDGGIGTLKVVGGVQLHASGGSIMDFQIAALNGLNGTVADNLNGSELNWNAILSGTMNANANDYLDIDGLLEVNSSGVTTVNLSLSGEAEFEAGMAWNLWDADQLSSTDSARYAFNFNGLDSQLASMGLAFDTSHFAEHGILAITAVVPEPTRGLLGAVALVSLLMRRKRFNRA